MGERSVSAGHNVAGGIEAAYRARTGASERLAGRARGVLPSGVVHDSRHMKPYGLYCERASGATKWDADGNRYIDFYGGHGALMLGHNPPEVVAAAKAQLDRGTHFAASNELEIRWAEQIRAMVPSAECVRFHSSGTEATAMAVRLARAFTGRNKLLRMQGHYHGWQDDMTSGYASHFDGSPVIGVPGPVAAQTLAVDPYDEARLEEVIGTDRDIAAVILEPLGAATGKIPIERALLARIREWTRAAGVVLIFDEVVTGFRVAPGGMQTVAGVTPDLTTLAKVVAGGLPGGAVAGRRDILDGLDFEASARQGREKVYHPGTFNACPVSAAAGITALEIIAKGDACARASALAAQLRAGFNRELETAGVPWIVYGEFSAFHIFMGERAPGETAASFAPRRHGRDGLQKQPADASRLLRLAMNLNGVDLSAWPGGLLSAAHSEADVAEATAAFAASLAMLREEGVI
ncbi:MAG: aminotransferase class III-fold pyridoxal phosphate-dependent enzyme [Rhizobiales bacterium]|nr:aminotransferase class III-fold pyridoxal phosphate-dependent enzyme [Hyphomicrobiales bacterium]